MNQIIDLFGLRLTATFGLILVLYLVWASAPVWWPAQRALLRRSRLPRPWTFVLTTATLCYGTTALAALLALPLGVPGPGLESMPHVDVFAVVSPMLWVAARNASALLVVAALFHLVLTGLITHHLANRWNALCAGLPQRRTESTDAATR